MKSITAFDQVAEAQRRITHVEDKRTALLSELASTRAGRAVHARTRFLNSVASTKEWENAVATENHTMSQLADVEALLLILNEELAAAEAGAKAAGDEARKTAFLVRLTAVVRERGIVVPPGGGTEFEAGAERAYNWLATVRRTTEVDRTRYLSHWLDEVSAARFGTVRRSELLAAAYIHGDIVVEDGGEAWNAYLGINQFIGREAQSVPFTDAARNELSVG